MCVKAYYFYANFFGEFISGLVYGKDMRDARMRFQKL